MSEKLSSILEIAHAHAKEVIAPNVDAWNAAKHGRVMHLTRLVKLG